MYKRQRLFRELNTDVSLRVEETEDADRFKVSGRGELHLSVLIENMRREGYEFAVSKAEVIYKQDEKGRKLEPMELVYIDVPEEFSGTVIQKLSLRKGELQGMSPSGTGYTRKMCIRDRPSTISIRSVRIPLPRLRPILKWS